MSEPIEITLHATLEHIEGPEIADLDHVLRWLCNEAADLEEDELGCVKFVVCPMHTSPEGDPCSFGPGEDPACAAMPNVWYRLRVQGADPRT